MGQLNADFTGKRVLVTGGTGFIGGRLIERLVREHDADVRALVRSFGKVSRIARFPVEIVRADLKDKDAIAHAVAGCDVIIHCAVATSGSESSQRKANVDGTRQLLDAALQNKVSRFVYTSTISVYGPTSDSDLDEKAPRQFAGNVYSDTKLEAENLTFEYSQNHGLPATIVQPTIVYGPFGPAWTTRIINNLKTGRSILVNGGNGLCNAVYVDDLVSGLILASVREEAVGQAFLVSGAEPVPWREFYAGYEKMIGHSSTVSLSVQEGEELFRSRFKRKGLLRESLDIVLEKSDVRWRLKGTSEIQAASRAARILIPDGLRGALKRRLTGDSGQTVLTNQSGRSDKPIHLEHPDALRFQAAKTHVRIDKARRLLGYEPVFDLAKGMKATEEWARWAQLLPAQNGLP